MIGRPGRDTWIERLPEVGEPMLEELKAVRAERERAERRRCLAHLTEVHATVLMCQLETKIRMQWTAEEIHKAQTMNFILPATGQILG